MPLRSKMFTRGISPGIRLDLEAISRHDSAHLIYGNSGEHVQRIQFALLFLMGADIPDDELHYRGQDKVGFYGTKTAKAVLAYKTAHKPPILNTALRQTKPDNIVGKKTIVALDDDLADGMNPDPDPPKPNPNPDPNPTPPPQPVRWEDRIVIKKTRSEIWQGTGPGPVLNPQNLPAPGEPLLDYLKGLAEKAALATVGADRVRDHPLEMGDPDFGTEKFRMERPVDSRTVMARVDVTIVVRVENTILPSGATTIIEREYAYTYGAGLSNRRVTIVRRIITPASAGFNTLQKVATVTITTPQPHSYIDP
jgi:hypothetical protein